MSTKYRPTVLMLLALLAALTLPGCGFSPHSAENFVNRAIARDSKGDLDGSIADCTKAIELNPKFFIAYDNRGNAKRAKGDLDGAIDDYSKAIEIYPKNPDA